MAKIPARATSHVANESKSDTDRPVRLTIAGSIYTDKSNTVNSLLKDRHAAKIHKGGLGREPHLFYEYRAAVEEQPKKFRIKIILLDESEIETDLRGHLEAILGAYDAKARFSEKAVMSMLEIEWNAEPRLDDIFREKRKSMSIDMLYADVRAEVISNFKRFPSNPDNPSMLVFDMDAAYKLELRAQDTTVWPFVYKVEVYCKSMSIKNLLITDCPSLIEDSKRLKSTMNEVMSNTEILITTMDYEDVFWRRKYSHYIGHAPDPAHHIVLITGDVSSTVKAGWEFGIEHGSFLLSQDETDQIENSRHNAAIANEAHDLAVGELRSIYRDSWDSYQRQLEDLWRKAEGIKCNIHVMLRAKQVKRILVQKVDRSLSERQVRRVFNEVYRNFLRKEEMAGDRDQDESDDDELDAYDYVWGHSQGYIGGIGPLRKYNFWTEEKSGIPGLRADVEERINSVLQARAMAVSEES